MTEEKTANPAPLGLMGFGMTTVLLNLVNAEILDAHSLGMILPMGIFYGGLAQIFAGMWAMKKGNTFAATAFSSYGLFWIALVFIILFERWEYVDPVPKEGIAAFLAMWGLFTLFMTFGTLRANWTLTFVFASLTLLFFLLAAGQFNRDVHIFGGYEGIVCGFSAIYLAMAEVLEEAHGKTILPVFPIKKKESEE